jgi:hypothetical protein
MRSRASRSTSTKTLVVEAGQDGQVLGELSLNVEDARIKNWKWHRIDENIKPDAGIAKVITDIRKPFLAGGNFKAQVNPFKWHEAEPANRYGGRRDQGDRPCTG